MASDRLALVTGAAGGMGSATVERLSRDGYRIAAIDIDRLGLEKVTQSADGRVQAYVADLTVEDEVRNVIATVQGEMGAIDALVNLIGWCETTRFVDENSEYWRRVIAINYESTIYTVHAVLPSMIERRSGKIVTVTSDAGRVGQSGEAVYAGAKGAAIAFSKSIAREVARYGIQVNCTAPGPTDTPLEAAQDPDIINRIIRAIPYRRMARPEEQAAAISFLCSPDASFLTGQTISVSGGLTML